MYVERQRKWIKEVGLEIGDKVLIASSASDEQGGWDDVWGGTSMDETIGLVGVVEESAVENRDENMSHGIRVRTRRGTWNYPFFVLVKV